ncbi:ABC-type amino acid transport substrate-binding protein [Paucibacter oligotrophus]|uniref:ABC-type amino acid transport substrate-binding protein n=1 Tax=Roseateles oligotrophus TaxID=1769250 RepID=A0A840L983_9BURK|nr:ABC transporter substrate-binding protein [Roseateles oligotrophus]MBB4844321.1 ABC-type amino acid transport substrate-binding protein [Roseateles oligotrophus]
MSRTALPAGSQEPVQQRRELLLTALALGLGLEACSPESPPSAKDEGQGAAELAASAASTPRTAAAVGPVAVDAPDISVNAMLLPGLVNSADEGTFIDLIKAVASVYKGGKFSISVAPVARVTDNVTRGIVDLGFPTLRMNPAKDAALPYRLTTAAFGRVNFVLYSNKARPLTKAMLEQAQREHKSGDFKYRIEAPRLAWDFPVQHFTNFESALRKVDAGRLDALLWAQEEADLELRRLGLKSIRRELYTDYEDVMMLPRGPRGDFVDKIISAAVENLQRSGRLQALYRKVHLPYDAWQP